MGQHIMGVKEIHRENCSLRCAQKAKRGEGWSPFKVTLPVTRKSSLLALLLKVPDIPIVEPCWELNAQAFRGTFPIQILTVAP